MKMHEIFLRKVFRKVKDSHSGSFINFSWLTFNQIIGIVFSFMISIMTARIFGPEGLGLFNYALAYTSLFNAVSQMGLESIVVKDLGQRKEDIGTVIGASLIILLLGSGLSIIAAVGGTFFFAIEAYRIRYVLLMCVPFLFNPLNIFKYWMVSQSNIKYYSIVRTIIQLVFWIIKILVIYIKRTVFLFVLVEVAESCTLLLSLYLAYRLAGVKFPKLLFHKDMVDRLLKVCIPLMFSSITVSIYMKIDQLMVGSLLGDAELGIYSIAVKLSEFWYVIPAMLYMAFLPHMSYLAYHDVGEYKTEMQKYADYLAIIGYLAIIVMYIVAKFMISFLYGKDYSYAGKMIMIYVWGGLATSIGYHFTAFVAIREWTKYSLLCTTISCVINIGLNRILIPVMGSMGAVAATVMVCFISTYFINMIYGIYNKEVREMMLMEVKALFPFIRVIREICN